ncbi:MAG: proline/glycine betaine ABC transporter permease [Hydromonas sp.]|nr:proline/glycine betaine ABC transporter permease [Hydromonas sp.]
MTWMQQFPTMGQEQLRMLRQTIDASFLTFSRNYGDALEQFFNPLRQFLIFSEQTLSQAPWLLVLSIIAGVAWGATRSLKLVLVTLLAFIALGYLGMWDDTMKTLSMILVATLLTIILGLPTGILLSRSNRLERVVNPVLDVMQTLPSFVYLIPVVMLLGIGRVPGIIAVIIYALPPVIRFTNLGIRLIAKDAIEVADAFGASAWQKLTRVQLPLALPTIMAGINQSIMLALAMVVIAAMIGVPGLGQPVLRAINNQYFTLGLFNGFAIVVIAIVFDRISQMYGKRLQKHLEVSHD